MNINTDIIKIEAIIVIYNKEIEMSVTYNDISNIKDEDIEVCIIDNSTEKNNNLLYCNKNKIKYFSMNGNKGLSKAYNKAIDNLGDSDVVVLFDDDTEINKKYFKELRNCVINYPNVDIFAPIVYGQNGVIYSPNEYHFFKNKLVLNKDKTKRNIKNFNAIASCLAIRREVFNNYRFNEKLFVDQIDQFFCYEQRKKGKRFAIINVDINQNFSQREKNLSDIVAWKRLKIRIRDIIMQSELMGKGLYSIIAVVKCIGLGIQIGIYTKSEMIVKKAVSLTFKIVFNKKKYLNIIDDKE